MGRIHIHSNGSLVGSDKKQLDTHGVGDMVHDYFTGTTGIIIEIIDKNTSKVLWNQNIEYFDSPERGYIFAPYIPLQVSNVMNSCKEVK